MTIHGWNAISDEMMGLYAHPDNFLVDDSNKVEEWYSSNIIVYIKKEKN
jgi:hypothetical protein